MRTMRAHPLLIPPSSEARLRPAISGKAANSDALPFPDIFARVSYLRAKSRESDSWTLWLSALKRLVISHNSDRQFDDILEHPSFSELDVSSVDNVLAGCSIAEISVLYEYLLATEDMVAKREHGQFFTPDDVAQFMAEKADSFPHGIWLDPCCGVGNLAYWLIARQDDPERFLLQSMRFIDLDARALLTARTLLTLAFQQSESHLFTQLESAFRQADFLSSSIEDVDFILMNPPYVQSRPPSDDYEAKSSRDMYAYFLERSLKVARGVIAITPQSFTHAKRHRDLRSVILRYATHISIYCFDNVPDNIFKGYKFGSHNSNRVNSTRAAVLVARRSQHSSGHFRITPLLRWRSVQRETMLRSAERFLGQPRRVGPELFPKIPPGLEALYEELLVTGTPLGDTLSPEGNCELVVPTTPRYFISGVRRPLDRASTRTLRFDNEMAFFRAYLTLNSSIAYFWWRVRDGGMTLSQDTLLTLPIDTSLDPSTKEARLLIDELQRSEKENLVVKMNSGRANENVKHPLKLVAAINRMLTPRYAERLLQLHANSNLGHTEAPL